MYLTIDAVLFAIINNVKWRQLPKEYGKWYSVWQRFDRWSKKGIWNEIFNKIRPELKEKLVAIDPTSIKVHQEATRYIKKL